MTWNWPGPLMPRYSTTPPRAILVVAEDGVISYANPAISRLPMPRWTSCKARRSLAFCRSPHMPDWFGSELYAGYRRGETWRLHDAILRTAPKRTAGGDVLCTVAPGAEGHGGDRAGHVASAHLHQQLEFQAVTDPLTGLLNVVASTRS